MVRRITPQRVPSVLLTALPLFIALLFLLPVQGIPISPDGAWYSGLALNLYHGEGYVDLDGTPVFYRPLFPTLLAVAYSLLGPSPFSSLVVLRLFYLSTVALLTLLARSLYGMWTGCFAGLLFLSSYALNEWSTWVNLDPILPAFLLLFLLLFHLGYKQNRQFLHILAGVALALAILVKETAIFYLALPFFVWLFQGVARTRWQIARGALLTWISTLITVAPWAWYVARQTGNPLHMLGRTPQWGSATLHNMTTPEPTIDVTTWGGAIFATLNRLQKYFDAIPTFYEWHLSPNFVLAPLLGISFVLILLASFRVSTQNSAPPQTVHANRYLALSILVFLPMILLQGVAGFRSRQSIIIFYLLMISLSWLITLPIRWWKQGVMGTQFVAADIAPAHGRLQELASTENTHQNFYRFSSLPRTASIALFVLVLLPAIGTVSWQTCCDRPFTMRHHLQHFNSLAAFTQRVDATTFRSPNQWWPTQEMIHSARDFATWAAENNIAAGQHILTHDNHHRYLNIMTDGAHQYFRIPPLNAVAKTEAAQQQTLNLILLTATQPNSVLWRNAGQNELAQFTGIRAYTQEQILHAIIENQIRYVVVGYPEKWLATYFLSHPDFQKVAELEYGTAHVFEVKNPTPSVTDFAPTIDKRVADLLRSIKRDDYARYVQLVDSLFTDRLGWSAEEIDLAIESATELAIRANAFSYTSYAQWSAATSLQTANEAYATQVEIQQAKKARSPQNPWPQIALGALYQQRAFTEQGQILNAELAQQSLDAYAQALQLDPNNWRAARRLVDLFDISNQLVDSPLLNKAVMVYEQEVEREVEHGSHSERAYRELATVYNRLERPGEAISAYEKVIARGIGDAGSYLSLGWIYEHTLSNVPTAIQTYAEGASTIRPDDPKYDQLVQRLGTLYTHNGQTEKAIALYQKAAHERVGSAWPHIELGKLYVNSEYKPQTMRRLFRPAASIFSNIGWSTLMHETAASAHNDPSIKWFQRALRINPQNRSARRGLGIALAQQGDEHGAIAVLQTIDGMGRELFHMGAQAERSRNWWANNPELAPTDVEQRTDLRLTWYNLAATVDPTLADSWYRLAQIHEEEQQWRAAKQAYQNGLHATERIEIQSSDMHFGLGRNLEKHSTPPSLDEAMRHYETAIADNAFSDPWVAVQTHYRRAQILRQRDRLVEAAEELDYVVAQRPASYWALAELAQLKQVLNGDVAAAETMLKRAISISPQIHYAYRELGQLYQQQQRWADAKAMYETALQHKPNDPVAQEQLRVVLDHLK